MGKPSRRKKAKSVIDYKNEGNEYFKAKKFTAAIKSYSLAIMEQQQQEQQHNADTLATLRGNRALAYIKIREFQSAMDDCDYILDELNICKNPKIWYRRALARQGILEDCMLESNTKQQRKNHKNRKKNSTTNEHREILIAAQQDLQRCLELDPDMQAAVDSVAQRLQKLVQLDEELAVSSSENNYETTSIQVSARPDAPSLELQKRDILQLLEQRRGASIETTQSDEAFFLIDWDWWCAFCTVVGLLDETIISILPRGAIAPRKLAKDYTLGEIDATTRLATDRPDRIEATSTEDRLILNEWLVRGHHYEVLPREVYATLVEWYGQRSPPMVRRARADRSIRLYDNAIQVTYEKPCAACGVPNATKSCRPCQIPYCSRECQERHWKAVHKQQCGKEITTTNSHRVGLGNLGNTCFMNSAIQALAHTTPIARYFLSGRFQKDINTSNPLGSGGKLALAFDATIAGLRMSKPSTTSFSPVQLRRALAGSRFAGCQQHDAQEFLGYMLDGLHEDLNRVRSYSYVELPDVAADQCHGIAGAEIWDAQSRRNDSLLWDTFYGQFKSTCVCPDCRRVSVSFDSFNHVSLEIPQNHTKVRVEVYMVYPDKDMERLGFCLSQQSTMRDLKREIASLIHLSNVSLCEVENHDVATIFADSTLVVKAPKTLFCYPIDTKAVDHWLTLCHQTTIDAVGVPQMLSIPRETATCRDLWEEVWRTVARFAGEDRSRIQIRLVARNGRPFAVFPIEDTEEKKGEGLEANGDNPQDAEQYVEKTSILPLSDNTLISEYLPPNGNKYMFLRIEWLSEFEVDENVLCGFNDHSTYIKMVDEYKAERAHKITLENCLATFTKPERLDDRNKWYCNKCKEHVPAMKTIELWRLPKILILHLKRFEFRTGFRREKLDMLVDFPLEGLEVTCSQNDSYDPSSLVDSRAPAVYDCFAVINHFGRMGFGHYTAFARRWDEQGLHDDWHLFDDSQARSVPNESVVSAAAYVVFYRRRE